MAYLDVITLVDAKNYLRVDNDLTEDDIRISSMIKAVLSMIERRTNVLVFARSKSYLIKDYCVSVYDYPINSITSPTDVDADEKTLYTNYYAKAVTDTNLVLNVGYTLPEDVPNEIIESALEYLKYLYYDSETNSGASNKIPLYIEYMIDSQKRYIL
jgi:hypothetical protein